MSSMVSSAGQKKIELKDYSVYCAAKYFRMLISNLQDLRNISIIFIGV